MGTLGEGHSPLPELVGVPELPARQIDGLRVVTNDHEVGEDVRGEVLDEPLRTPRSVVHLPHEVTHRSVRDQTGRAVRGLVDVQSEVLLLALTEVGFRRVLAGDDVVVPDAARADDELAGIHAVSPLVEPHQNAVLGTVRHVDDVVDTTEVPRVRDTDLRDRGAVHSLEAPVRMTEAFELGVPERSGVQVHEELGIVTVELQVQLRTPDLARRGSRPVAVLVGCLLGLRRLRPLGLLTLAVDDLQTLREVGDGSVELQVNVHVGVLLVSMILRSYRPLLCDYIHKPPIFQYLLSNIHQTIHHTLL